MVLWMSKVIAKKRVFVELLKYFSSQKSLLLKLKTPVFCW
jgi:hypothetical protein